MSGPLSPQEWYAEVVRRYGLHEIALDARVLCESVALPPVHRDPCDRMIIAAAKVFDVEPIPKTVSLVARMPRAASA